MLQGEGINMSLSAPFKEDKNKGLLDEIIRSPLWWSSFRKEIRRLRFQEINKLVVAEKYEWQIHTHTFTAFAMVQVSVVSYELKIWCSALRIKKMG